MKQVNLPEPPYHTIDTLAQKWGTTPERVSLLIATEQLPLSVESRGWWIEKGTIVDDEEQLHREPEDYQHSLHGNLIKLSHYTSKAVVRTGACEHPAFASGDYDYAIISRYHHGEHVKISIKDVVIDNNDIMALERNALAQIQGGSSNEQQTKQKRNNELHQCIGLARVRLMDTCMPHDENSIWKHLRDNHQSDDAFECIEEMTHSQKRGEEVIRWKTPRGQEKTMNRSTFRNVVSSLNTGKKKLTAQILHG